jgi:hypothetical protein
MFQGQWVRDITGAPTMRVLCEYVELGRLLKMSTCISPFTCRSTSWIYQLCYGRSPTYGDLVELGEVVGIIAGQ